MRFLVFGAGGIGSAFGGFLSRRHEVTLLGREWHIGPIRKRGLKVTGIWGDHVFKDFAGLYHDETKLERARGDFDYVLLTTKANDTAHSAEIISRVISRDTIVVSLQNGLGNIEKLAKRIDSERILGGRVIFGVVLGKGSIEVTVSADDTLIGEAVAEGGMGKARRLAALFNECGLKSRAAKDIHRHIWSKVIYNCALNPLASILNTTYGELLNSDDTKRLMREIVGEIYGVAEAMKIKLTPPTAKGYVRLLFTKLIPLTAAHHPSMLQAINHRKKTEISALNGAISELGRHHEVQTPVNDFLTRLVTARETLAGCR